jgi:hypothetical protein
MVFAVLTSQAIVDAMVLVPYVTLMLIAAEAHVMAVAYAND